MRLFLLTSTDGDDADDGGDDDDKWIVLCLLAMTVSGRDGCWRSCWSLVVAVVAHGHWGLFVATTRYA